MGTRTAIISFSSRRSIEDLRKIQSWGHASWGIPFDQFPSSANLLNILDSYQLIIYSIGTRGNGVIAPRDVYLYIASKRQATKKYPLRNLKLAA